PMTAYIAFLSSERLRHNSETLVANIDKRVSASQSGLLNDIMVDFTDEVLQVFFIDIIDLLKLSPFMSKLIHGSVGTIKSTIHSISRTIINKLDNKQLLPMADYVGSLMLTAPDVHGHAAAYVGFPISADTYKRLHDVITKMRDGQTQEQIPALTAVLNEVTDLAMEAYFTNPIELLKLGFILRKMAEGGVSVIRGAVHMVIRKLVPDLTHDQLLAVAEYMDSLILRSAQPYR
ncbi:MAG: hypothetical protein Q8J78_09925, partial [Moraxellaceae bacterium]|nr:hypothetical protein [Moraxellaceae bacterium]